MGYLNIAQSKVPDFTKAVISLWFRVPQASIDACVAAAASAASMSFVIPLVTFGKPQQIINYVGHQVDVTTYTFDGVFLPGAGIPEDDTPTYDIGGTTPADPSYIGLACGSGGADSPNVASILLNLQTAALATLSGYNYNRNSVIVWGPDSETLPVTIPFAPGNGWAPAFSQAYQTTEVDTSSYIANTQPGFYNIVSPINLAPDQWHHILLSFDISNGCTVVGVSGNTPSDIDSGVIAAGKMWLAIDDVNYDGNNLGGFGGSDPNLLLTVLANDAISKPASVDGFNCNNGPAEYSLTNAPIPSHGSPIGLPASAAFVDNIFKVEMAEFQMFTGVSMDTGVVKNRRAFIGADMLPVNPFAIGELSDPTQGVDPLTLIAPGPPQKLLGKRPDIALTSSSLNWTGGVNIGTGGGLKAAGTIKPFLPNPKVGR